MQVRDVRAVVVETNPSFGVLMDLPMLLGEPIRVYMLADSAACQWAGDGRILSSDEFVGRLQVGSVIEISGTLELRGRRSHCSDEEYAKSPNKFWIQPYSARLRS